MTSVDFKMPIDEDLYTMFDQEPTFNLEDNESYRKLLMSSNNNRSNQSIISMRLGTSTGTIDKFQSQGIAPPRPGTGYRPMTKPLITPATSYRISTSNLNAESGNPDAAVAKRPITAVRGVGYTSQGHESFDPLNDSAKAQRNAIPESPKEDTYFRNEDKVQILETEIMKYIEESILASVAGNPREGLEKAKEASNKEKNLIRLQENLGLSDSHNLDLTFMVLYNLANHYDLNEYYNEALNTYLMLTKNKMFTNASRLKVNMGNIYYKQGQFNKAIKMYRMALDQVSSTHKSFRIKIMHNIGLVFARMGQYSDAVASFDYIMSERPDIKYGFQSYLKTIMNLIFRSGMHLLMCYYILEDIEKMKSAFISLVDVPLDIDFEEDKYKVQHDACLQKEPEEILIADAIRDDELHRYEQSVRKEAETDILTAATLIAPKIDKDFSAGYDWCGNVLKGSVYIHLLAELEVSKSVMYLRKKKFNEAVETLRLFETDSVIPSSAATNLSFIYYLKGDYDSAVKYGEMGKHAEAYNACGYVNLGACAMAKKEYNKAKNYFETALDWDPTNFEALYNLGLVLKKQRIYTEAFTCFQKFTGGLSLLPEVLYQEGCMMELLGDEEAAADFYQQLLGIVPTDSKIMHRLGIIFDHEGDKQQAYQYHFDSFRYYPANMEVISWLGSYFIELQVVEKAQMFFEKAAIIQPLDPKWRLMVAGCVRRSGNLHKSLALYQEIHQEFPENIECLKFLIRIASDLGIKEAAEYTMELKKIERTREVRERVNSSRPGTASRRSGSSLSLRSAGISPAVEVGNSHRISSPATTPLSNSAPVLLHQTSRSSASSGKANRLATLHDSMDSEEGSLTFSQPKIDASYTDPLGPMTVRPKTSSGRNFDDEFGEEPLDDDLLPE